MSTASAITPPHLDDFAGAVLHDCLTIDPEALRGKRVALVGDPRRVVRALPRLAGRASTLKVFQTDGVWVLPAYGAVGPALDALAPLMPSTLRWRIVSATATCNLRRGVPDGWTRRHLQPQRHPTKSSTARSDGYFRALRRPDVELVGWPIADIVPSGIRTADGIQHNVDVIVVA